MKLKINICLIALLFGGCSDFLEESSQDEIRPSTVEDMEQLINGEALPRSGDYWENMTDIFTDDRACYGYNRYKTNKVALENDQYKFGWLKGMFDANEGHNEVKFWEYPYKRIAGCNLVLGYIDRVSGDQKKKDNLRGEAYAMRGYYYLNLVNFFGLPYHVGDPEKNPAVPLKLTMDISNEYLARNTVAEVYRSIEKDLLEADRLLKANPMERGLYHMDCLVVEALLSRMYLYMENWDKAIEYAGQVLQVKPQLLDLSQFEKTEDDIYTQGIYSSATSAEVLWRFVGSQWGGGNEYNDPANYCVSEEFLSCFDDNPDKGLVDIRRYFYVGWVFDKTTWEPFYDRVLKDPGLACSGIRNAELYLNLAEAYARKFMSDGNIGYREEALKNLDFLRKHRYDTRLKPYEALDIQEADELLEFCMLERRRELCGEGNHRWFDLRRNGMPALKHVWFLNRGEEQVYTLEENSPRYVLPIPSQVMDYNRGLMQNP